MARTLEQIATEALELPENDRLTLGEQLLSSVPPDPAVIDAWDAEIARRVDEIRAGGVRGVAAEDVDAELREIVS